MFVVWLLGTMTPAHCWRSADVKIEKGLRPLYRRYVFRLICVPVTDKTLILGYGHCRQLPFRKSPRRCIIRDDCWNPLRDLRPLDSTFSLFINVRHALRIMADYKIYIVHHRYYLRYPPIHHCRLLPRRRLFPLGLRHLVHLVRRLWVLPRHIPVPV